MDERNKENEQKKHTQKHELEIMCTNYKVLRNQKQKCEEEHGTMKKL